MSAKNLRVMQATATLREIRERLGMARIAANMTQQTLADALGRSRETIHRWEVGKQDPSVAEFSAWAAVLGGRVEVTGLVTSQQGEAA